MIVKNVAVHFKADCSLKKILHILHGVFKIWSETYFREVLFFQIPASSIKIKTKKWKK